MRLVSMRGVGCVMTSIANNNDVIHSLAAQPLVGFVMNVELGIREAERANHLAILLAQLVCYRARA